METKYITAIDIGTTKTVVLIAKIDENGINILGIGTATSRGIKKGVVKNVEEAISSIKKAIERAIKDGGIGVSNIFVGITSHQIKTIFNKGSRYIDNNSKEIMREDVEILINDMRKISIPSDDEILEIFPQTYIIDGDPGESNPIGITANRLEADFKIIISKQISKIGIKKSLNRLGLDYKNVFLNPIASAAAVLSEDELEAGVVLVDIGAGVTDVTVFYDSIVRHVAVIPFGGNVITKDIKEGCQILLKDAELLKIQFGSAIGDNEPEDKVVSIAGINGRKPKEISFRSLAFIIQARMEEIVQEVANEIEKSDYYNRLGAGIVMTGGGAMLKNLDELMAYITGLEVRIGTPSQDHFTEIDKGIYGPDFATSLGLLVEAAKNPKLLDSPNVIDNEINSSNDSDDNEENEEDEEKKIGFFEKIKNLLTDNDIK